MAHHSHLQAIEIRNYRSIVDPLTIPLTEKVTFLVGQNNSGKTGILRFLALVLSKANPAAEDQSTLTTNAAVARCVFATEAFVDSARRFTRLTYEILDQRPSRFTLRRALGAVPDYKLETDIGTIVNEKYFNPGGGFSYDFGHAGSRESNVRTFTDHLVAGLSVPESIYVPNLRRILSPGMSIPHFGQIDFPGEKISTSNVVNELAHLDRPFGTTDERKTAREKLDKICQFIQFCLESGKVEITVPEGKQTIYVKVGDNEQPIANVGSGIEQLILIGLGSFNFPKRIVLIDEPELHLHPRMQKRMMQFLSEQAEVQFVIATHSSAIIDSIPADIVQVWQHGEKTLGRTVETRADRYRAIRHLGHSPSELVLTNFVIWVEGPSDRVYLNFWIKRVDDKLCEGSDYTILFYGGAVLAQHQFDDSDDDLVKSLSVSRNFAVFMDSDRSSDTCPLKERVERVAAEAEKNNGFVWISAGREIENYIPQSVLDELASFNINAQSAYTRLWNGEHFNKVKFAEAVVSCDKWEDQWPLDLREKTDLLVKRIRDAR